MRTPVVDRAKPPARRRVTDVLFVIVAALLLLFALIGVVSAARFVADNAGGSKTPTPTVHARPAATSVALQDIARAQAQATAIVKAAQSAGSTIIKSNTAKARTQAKGIIAAANKQAAARTSSSGASSPSSGSNSAPSSGTASGTGSGTSSSGTGGQSTASSGVTVNTPIGPCSTRGMPASWQLIVCGTSFGRGPGSAGGVSLYNRGAHPFNGVVRVDYVGRTGATVGSATAAFRNVPGGYVALVPLNGPAYPSNAVTWRVHLVSLSP